MCVLAGLGNTFNVFRLFGGLMPVIIELITSVSVTVVKRVSKTVTFVIQVSKILITATFEVSMQFPDVDRGLANVQTSYHR